MDFKEKLKALKRKEKIIVLSAIMTVIVLFAVICHCLFVVIETKEIRNCKDETPMEYYTNGDLTVYLSCISKVYIRDGLKKIELKEYLKGTKSEFDEKIKGITSYLYGIGPYMDGGTINYIDSNVIKRTNNGITFTVCHTLNGSNNIYISPAAKERSYQCR